MIRFVCKPEFTETYLKRNEWKHVKMLQFGKKRTV